MTLHFRLKVREAWAASGMSMQMLSHRSELDYKTVQRLVRDPERNADLETLARIAMGLQVDVSTLIRSEPPIEPVSSSHQ